MRDKEKVKSFVTSNPKDEIEKSLIPLRIPEKKGLDRQTDGQQSDPIRVPFFPYEPLESRWSLVSVDNHDPDGVKTALIKKRVGWCGGLIEGEWTGGRGSGPPELVLTRENNK
ncbi:hypothetical protein EVAR_38860_1 [Eumeta japonica]|uniref:Uncharacterized protein n=1 Tax=Eumeta variegata TaxID=151549 RepID=A0A4C1X4I0_EUMVA|nr:hypothetical protein EVAR_38860_1 [Eumeta japonica]